MNPLNNDDVKEIFSAISVAECEGFEFNDLKFKLYELYPDVKKEHDERDRKQEEHDKRVSECRKNITQKFFDKLDRRKIMPYLMKQMETNFTTMYQEIRENYSDEICLSADLYKYFFVQLKEAGLIEEIRAYQRITKDTYALKQSDKDTWYTLERIFQNLNCKIQKKVEMS